MDVGRFFINSNPALRAAFFRRSLLAWYRQNGRDLPWRRTRDPYAILVSEFMLQQTQVASVIPHYIEWMRRFPDFAALAAAEEGEVLHSWEGLGYYARARNLHATAQLVIKKHRGELPRSVAALRGLPGIGLYTANAIATFAFDQPVAVVEANISRLFARLFDLHLPIDTTAGRAALWNRAAELVPARDAAKYNSALMDLGALVCRPQPRCDVCPVKKICAATEPAKLPIKKTRPTLQRRSEHHTFAMRAGRVLLEQSQDRWRGMWMLPRLAAAPRSSRPLHVSEFPFTHHRITLSVFAHTRIASATPAERRWFLIRTLHTVAVPSPHRRALRRLLAGKS